MAQRTEARTIYEQDRQRIGCTQHDVWQAYSEQGGKALPNAVESWLRGRNAPRIKDAVYLCLALKVLAERNDLPPTFPDLRFLIEPPGLQVVEGGRSQPRSRTDAAAQTHKGYIPLNHSDLHRYAHEADAPRRNARKVA